MDKDRNPEKQEKRWWKFWQEEEVYKFDPENIDEIYSIDTPPPTLSGDMHIGHALSYTQQDIIARYKRMKGKQVFYPFGTDDNGLATERLVERENDVDIFDMERKEFIKLCQETIEDLRPEFVKSWKQIGVSCDFDLSYSTISQDAQKISQKYFLDLYEKDRTYQEEGPTTWCPECQTAIAQVEMEDDEKKSVFYDLKFETEEGELTIATTRPELLPSCVAVFVHPDDNRFSNFVGKEAETPLGDEVEILEDEAVDPEKGSGAVMCCTFGDERDIEWYKKHDLPLKNAVQEDGTLNQIAGEYEGMELREARDKIVEDLKEKGLITGEEKIEHTVNVHERCKTPVEIIPTNQWFIEYLDLKDEFVQMGEELEWTPPKFETRYRNWVEGLKWDWCISRQRYFGVPFPVWYCKNCGEEVLADISQLPVDPSSDSPKKGCPNCGEDDFVPEKDVLDTWATSSLTPQLAQDLVYDKKAREEVFPMDLRPQAHDIINFWLFYTVARSKIHFDSLPWEQTAISGFVLDEDGEKMSKSKGNVIDPQKVISEHSADALRYWVSSVGFGQDIRWSEEEIQVAERALTKIWNATRFSTMHLEEFDPNGIDQDEIEFEPEDKWILAKFHKMIGRYDDYFEEYNYAKARKELDDFFWDYFTANYIEMIKDRLYNSKRNPDSARYALYQTLLGLIKLYAPFIPFITEEIYQDHFKQFEDEKSIHISSLPEKKDSFVFEDTEGEIDGIVEVITAIRKYKSENDISLGKEIESISVKSQKENLEKYFPIIKDTANVESISLGQGNLEVTEEISISIEE